MAPKSQRPDRKRPKELPYWKKRASPLGTGFEICNSPSPLAQQLWYYARSLGHVTHSPGWKNEHHGRDGYVLHVIRRGALSHEIRARRHLAGQGEACLLDLQHDVRYDVDGNSKADFWWVWLNGKDMPGVFLALGADQNPVFPLGDLKEVESLLRRLRTLALHEPRGFEAKSSGLLALVLAELFTCRADRIEAQSFGLAGRPFSVPVRQAIDWMHRRYDEVISVKNMAWEAGQSPTYFSRRFHQEVGISPMSYLIRYRIEQAKKFLTTSNETVEETALSVGFHSQSRFSRTFKRIVGVTPLAYRKHPEKVRRSR